MRAQEFFAGLIMILLLIVLPVGLMVAIEWNASGVEARIYNRTYGTDYTQEDFFWAGSTIRENIHQGRQSKLNVAVETN